MSQSERTLETEPQPPDKESSSAVVSSSVAPAATSAEASVSSDENVSSVSVDQEKSTSAQTGQLEVQNPPVQRTHPAQTAPPQPAYPHQPYGYGHHQAAYPHTPYYPPHSTGYPYGYGYPPQMQNGYHHPPQPAPTYPAQPTPYTSVVPGPQPHHQDGAGVDDLPSYEEMIVEALTGCTDPEGWAPKDLFSWMASRYPLQSNFRPSASQALQKAYKRGRFEKSSNGRYRLNASWEGGNVRAGIIICFHKSLTLDF